MNDVLPETGVREMIIEHSLHDLAIKLIIEFLHGENDTLMSFIRVSRRFYGFRELCYQRLCLSERQSSYAYNNKPPGWNRVYEMDLDCILIRDLTLFRGIHTLHLSYGRNITDVSPLSQVHTLTIYCCNKLTDVSPLNRVHNLDISYCINLEDVSPLGTVHTLNLKGLHKVRDVSALGSVNTLKISFCNDIRDVSALRRVPHLIVENCNVQIY